MSELRKLRRSIRQHQTGRRGHSSLPLGPVAKKIKKKLAQMRQDEAALRALKRETREAKRAAAALLEVPWKIESLSQIR